MNGRWGTVAIALALAVPLGLGGCSRKQRVKAETEVAKALIDDKQLDQLGMRMHAQMEQEGLDYLQDPVVTGYVEQVAKRIFAQADEDRPDVEWHAHVVEDPETVNAFATPGGHIYVTTGLLRAAESEAELAAVLGHEAGHLSAYHPSRRLVAALGLQTVAQLSLGENPNTLAVVAANVAGQGLLLAHSRADEHEADDYGVRYTAEAGYDPRALAQFFEKLKEQQGEVPGVLQYLMTHPAPEERIKRVEGRIERRNVRGGELGRDEYRKVMERLPEPTGKPAGKPK